MNNWNLKKKIIRLTFENCALLSCYAASSDNFFYRFFGTDTPEDEPIGCPETLVRNYYYYYNNTTTITTIILLLLLLIYYCYYYYTTTVTTTILLLLLLLYYCYYYYYYYYYTTTTAAATTVLLLLLLLLYYYCCCCYYYYSLHNYPEERTYLLRGVSRKWRKVILLFSVCFYNVQFRNRYKPA